jgi:hypothetical protein
VTLEQFETACGKTLLLLKNNQPHDIEMKPRRVEVDPTHPDHLAWCLIQAALFYSEGRLEKANRWLGFVQGAIAAQRGATLEELKRANMPEDAVYDAERVGGEP